MTKMTPIFQNPGKKILQEILLGSQVDPNSKHWKMFVCPVCVTENTLQAMQQHHKGTECSKVGVYQETLPIHSNNVALVQSLKMMLVIPQFHVRFDTQLQMVGQEYLT